MALHNKLFKSVDTISGHFSLVHGRTYQEFLTGCQPACVSAWSLAASVSSTTPATATGINQN
jgi:hypothetical protein